MVLVKGFNRYEAAELTGIPYERFTYLDKTGVLKPVGKYGRLVLYSFEQILKAMVIDFYKDIFDNSDTKWFLEWLQFQLEQDNRHKELVYFKLLKGNQINFYVDFIDETLSFKEFKNKLISKVEIDEGLNKEDFAIEIHIIKSVNYFVNKMMKNAEKSERVSPEEFLERAGLKDF